MKIAFLGFGEAAQAFLEGWDRGPGRPGDIHAYDRKTEDAPTRAAKRDDYVRWRVTGALSTASAVGGADIVLSVVTADQAAAAAAAAAGHLAPGTLYLDMNSVAPETKRRAAAAVEAAGGRYADVAVMAPVRPQLLGVPLLTSGPHAAAALETLTALGFRCRPVAGPVGAASAVKMIRSIMVKGMEALTAECVLSAYAAGVQDEVLGSLERSHPDIDWRRQADYNLDRMIVHGQRRAAEMEESARTAAGLGQTGAMARATATWQARIGALGLDVPDGLEAKVTLLLDALRRAAEVA